ncbi:MAG: hypothetical protein J3K34DRAFT_485867 [Monoraphidium minutum]|nr:MAG: hypothetical protein J3K34DRAFT_485867 [Monoraphidium minutum]
MTRYDDAYWDEDDEMFEKEDDELAPAAAGQALPDATTLAVLTAHPCAPVKGFGALVGVVMRLGARLAMIDTFTIDEFEQGPAAAAAGGAGTRKIVCRVPKAAAAAISALFTGKKPPSKAQVMTQVLTIEAYEAARAPAGTPDSEITIRPGAKPSTLAQLLFQKAPGSVSVERELRKLEVLINLEARRLINVPLAFVKALAECSVAVWRDAAAPAGLLLGLVESLACEDPPVPWARGARAAAESKTQPIDVGALERHFTAKEVTAAARGLEAAAAAAAGGGGGGGGGGKGTEEGGSEGEMEGGGGEEERRAARPPGGGGGSGGGAAASGRAAGKPPAKRARSSGGGQQGAAGSGGGLAAPSQAQLQAALAAEQKARAVAEARADALELKLRQLQAQRRTEQAQRERERQRWALQEQQQAQRQQEQAHWQQAQRPPQQQSLAAPPPPPQQPRSPSFRASGSDGLLSEPMAYAQFKPPSLVRRE